MKYLQFTWLSRDILFPVHDIVNIEHNTKESKLCITTKDKRSYFFKGEDAIKTYNIVKEEIQILDTQCAGTPQYTNKT
jgi:hypothetical protein